jgi:DNA-binding NtrC family response regulator
METKIITLDQENGLHLVYRCPLMEELIELVYKSSHLNTIILLLGESGTGKELIAKLIHLKSTKKEGNFVPVNCGAIPENLLENELFGHEKGAFTSADKIYKGRFEESNDGTLFLDEIGELSFALQVKLLRVIQEKSFRRLGGKKNLAWNGRLLLATHRNLEQMVIEQKFREDLYYRIFVMPISIPALRQRQDDLEPMIEYFLDKFSKETGKPKPSITEKAVTSMAAYPWPGNVRELENCLLRSLITCKDNIIQLEDLPEKLLIWRERSKDDSRLARRKEDYFTRTSFGRRQSDEQIRSIRAMRKKKRRSDKGTEMSRREGDRGNQGETATDAHEDGLGQEDVLDKRLGKLSFQEIIKEEEKKLIQSALKRCHYNQTNAAKLLKINRRTLNYKIQQYGINEL